MMFSKEYGRLIEAKNHLINEYKNHNEWLIEQVKAKNEEINSLQKQLDKK